MNKSAPRRKTKKEGDDGDDAGTTHRPFPNPRRNSERFRGASRDAISLLPWRGAALRPFPLSCASTCAPACRVRPPNPHQVSSWSSRPPAICGSPEIPIIRRAPPNPTGDRARESCCTGDGRRGRGPNGSARWSGRRRRPVSGRVFMHARSHESPGCSNHSLEESLQCWWSVLGRGSAQGTV